MWFFLYILLGCTKSQKRSTLLEKDRMEGVFWQIYSEDWLRNHKDNPYIIYITADWCLTCTLFEQQVLREEYVQDLFLENNVSRVRADGSQDDIEIERLKSHYEVRILPIFIYVQDPAGPYSTHIVLSEKITKEDIKNLFFIP